jgi:histidine ammonia-lyase
MRMVASRLPEMLGALAIDVRAAQTDIAQHAVVEVQEQVTAARPFPPTTKSAREVREQPMQSSGSEDDGQPIRRQTPACIDTIPTGHLVISSI